jgi:hypothetical protein
MTVLASGLWHDPAVFAIRVVVAVLLVALGLMFMVIGLMDSEVGGPQTLWYCVWGFLMGAVGCLIGSVTAVLWYLGLWAGVIAVLGVIFGACALGSLLWMSVAVPAKFLHSVRESRRRDAYIFSKPGQPRRGRYER